MDNISIQLKKRERNRSGTTISYLTTAISFYHILVSSQYPNVSILEKNSLIEYAYCLTCTWVWWYGRIESSSRNALWTDPQAPLQTGLTDKKFEQTTFHKKRKVSSFIKMENFAHDIRHDIAANGNIKSQILYYFKLLLSA